MRLVTTDDQDHQVLLEPAQPVQFALDASTKNQIDEMERFVIELDQDHGVAGLAAPQVGLGLRVIFFQVQAEWKKFRQNVYDEIPLMPLFNPSYEPLIADGMDKDFEACFSVPNIAAEVYRYKTIVYRWQDVDGDHHQSEAKGFLARLIQHEVDHLEGILHTSLPREDCSVITIDELRARRERLRSQNIAQGVDKL